MSTGKRAVVTGGANGIGQAFCKRLAAQGAKIVIADIADCSETVGATKKSGGIAIAVRCDQTSEADVAKLRAAVEKRAERLRHPRALHRYLPDGGHRRDNL